MVTLSPCPRPALFGRTMPGWGASEWARYCRRRAWACVRQAPELAELWLEWGFAVALQVPPLAEGSRCRWNASTSGS